MTDIGGTTGDGTGPGIKIEIEGVITGALTTVLYHFSSNAPFIRKLS